jgi:hypothetical protein
VVLSTEDLQEEEIHDEEVGAGSRQNFWKTRHVETVPAALGGNGLVESPGRNEDLQVSVDGRRRPVVHRRMRQDVEMLDELGSEKANVPGPNVMKLFKAVIY